LLLLVVLFVAVSPLRASLYQTTGHTDIRFLYDVATGTPDIAYFLDIGSTVGGQSISVANPMGGTPVTVGGHDKIRFEPSQLVTYIPDPPVARPTGTTWNFTGTTAGSPLWYISQGLDSNKPWTGISTESVSTTDFSNVKYQLTAFNGPGQMSVTTTGSFGAPTVYFQTSNGLSSTDVLSLSAGTHAHYNWFFTEMGTYTFELTAIGTRTAATGGGTVSVADTFTFQVVPEPSAFVLLALATMTGAVVVFRKRKSKVTIPSMT
jgi:surface-anchored protein